MQYTHEHPSPEYLKNIELGKAFHRRSKTWRGPHIFQQYPILRVLCQQYGTQSILDYGCGKGEHIARTDIRLLNCKSDTEKHIYPSWKEALGVDDYFLYDPCVPQYADLPNRMFDGIVSVDVFQYITQDDVPWILNLMFSRARQWVFSSFGFFAGTKSYEDGSDAHRIYRNAQWWIEQWYVTGLRYPQIYWSFRLEIEQPPITHRYFTGHGDIVEEKPGYWPVWKPQQLQDLSKKQREELEMIAKKDQEPIDLEKIKRA